MKMAFLGDNNPHWQQKIQSDTGLFSQNGTFLPFANTRLIHTHESWLYLLPRDRLVRAYLTFIASNNTTAQAFPSSLMQKVHGVLYVVWVRDALGTLVLVKNSSNRINIRSSISSSSIKKSMCHFAFLKYLFLWLLLPCNPRLWLFWWPP